MQSKLPPLPSLQAFEAAARHENFAAAAKELNLSQSAVSHRVRTLERHLGYPLFERLPRGLRLTEPAKAYLPSLRRAFEEILSATSGIFGHGGRSVLNVRAPISYTVLWLAPLVDRFNAEFPQIEIHLSSSIWTEKIATGETDVEFRIGRGSWPGVEASLLFRDPLVPVCSPEFAARRNAIDDPAALAECSLVHVMGTEDYWSKFFQQAGVERKRKPSDFSVDSSLAAAEIATVTDRIALIHQPFATHYVKTKRLVIASDTKVIPQEAIYMLSPIGPDRRSPEAVLFEKWLRSRIDARISGLPGSG